MKPLHMFFLAMALNWPSVTLGADRDNALRVVTTLSDLAWLAETLGGERVQAKSICTGYQDPHYLEAKPSYARDLRDADLLVYAGLELEVGWLPRLLEAAHNPDLRPGSPRLYEASSAVKRILEVPQGGVDRSQGDIHPFGNPHFLLDPRNMLLVADGLCARMTQLDPSGAPTYQAGLSKLHAMLEPKIAEWEKQAASLRGSPVVGFHKQWEYLADWLGLDLVGYIEDRPGIPPSPKHLNELITMMKTRQVRTVLVAPFNDVKEANEVAQRAGVKPAVLPAAVGGVENTGNYIALMDVIVSRLLNAAT
ncbi:MAG TPA: metal ABC transporter substrate-binding protein [Candidatus Eisenbacteria bacterium]|nr:metal ABC transporter substrate-binding protein [Candidatus Eisenbacteria bacterium]